MIVWVEERGKKEIIKVQKETFDGDIYSHYLDCGNEFTFIEICKNLSKCTC